MKRLAEGTLWIAGLGAAAVALHWAGTGALAAPPLTEPGRWATWVDSRDSVSAAFGILRLVVLCGLWYLIVVTLLGAGLRAAGAVRLVRIADRFTVGPVRRMLAGSISLGLAASGFVAVAAPAIRLPAAVAQTSTTSTTPGPPATVTMHRLGPAEPSAVSPVPQVTPVATPAPAPDRWTVKPGECFWTIAEDVLTKHLGHSPTDAEIVPYWRRLIEANRSGLAHRDNPDLVFPSQTFVLPAP